MPKHLPLLFLKLIALLILLGSCEVKKQKKAEKWPNSIQVQLLQEDIYLNLPNTFKRSSRYRIHQDLPLMSRDTTQLLIAQNFLKNIEFEDAEVDVFVDTMSKSRLLVIVNTEHMFFDKNLATKINAKLKGDYANLERSNPFLIVTEIDSRIKNNKRQKVLKFKHEITNTLWNSKLYKTTYFITTDIQSFVIYELSIEKEDVEYYLWSIKD